VVEASLAYQSVERVKTLLVVVVLSLLVWRIGNWGDGNKTVMVYDNEII
jgi:hypothetical protein